jgi:hypothetical protein
MEASRWVRRFDVFVELLLRLELSTARRAPEAAAVFRSGVLVELFLRLELRTTGRTGDRHHVSPPPLIPR